MTVSNCPICHTAAQITPGNSFNEYVCEVCGTFYISPSAEAFLGGSTVDYKISAWIREHKEYGKEPPEISNTLDDLVLPDYNPNEKQLLLLRALERRTKYPGFTVDLNYDFAFPLAWAANS